MSVHYECDRCGAPCDNERFIWQREYSTATIPDTIATLGIRRMDLCRLCDDNIAELIRECP